METEANDCRSSAYDVEIRLNSVQYNEIKKNYERSRQFLKQTRPDDGPEIIAQAGVKTGTFINV